MDAKVIEFAVDALIDAANDVGAGKRVPYWCNGETFWERRQRCREELLALIDAAISQAKQQSSKDSAK